MLDWLFGKKKEEPKKKNDDKKWKYDLLVQFLCSPEWRVTLLNFVDQNCVVFDTEEENKFEYTNIHKQFKKLVAGLFDSFMDEVGIGSEELVELIQKGLESKNKKLFEQLLICDDFLKFKEIMVKRNKALEQEAAEQLLKQGTKSKLIESTRNKTPEQLEEEMIRKAIEQSERQSRIREEKMKKQQMEELQKHQQIKRRQSEKAQQELRNAENEIRRSTEVKRAEEQRQKQQEMERHRQDLERLRLQEEQRKQEEARQKEKAKQLPPVRKLDKVPKLQPTEPEIIAEPVKQAVPQPPAEKTESVEQRKKRLMEQRQILKKKRMEQRKKELEKGSEPGRVQNIVLDNAKGIVENVSKQEMTEEEKISQDEIERRRNLMKRIKNKIIDDI